jgi:xanthine dehydrogenase large subunit
VPNTSATAASSGADLNGKAAQAAASTLRKRLVAHACAKYRVGGDRVRFDNGEVRIGKRTLSFKELVASAYAARVSLSSTGFYATPKIHWDRSTFNGRPFFYFAYGAAVSEVAIDTLTGETRLLRVDILHDVGTSLNPAIDMGQIEGGFLQGVGWLTSEELYWNDRGELQTHAPSTYKIPSVRDWPVEANVRILEHEPNREDTIYRSKAVGEPPLMLCISTFLAIRDAIAACAPASPDSAALPDLRAPATPEAVLRALDSLLPPGEGGPKARMRVGDREGADEVPDPIPASSLEERPSDEEPATQSIEPSNIDMPWQSPTLTPTPLPEGEGFEANRSH